MNKKQEPVPNHNIQGFILQTLQGPLNDQTNAKFWVPGLLKGLKQDGKSVLPFKVDTLNVGALQGSAAAYITQAISGSWAITKSFQNPKVKYAIGNPSDPNPAIDMSSLTINGLENLKIISSSTIPNAAGTGYQSTILAQFNTYDKSAVANELTATGNFTLHQEVCSCDAMDSTQCNGIASDDVVGEGTFNVLFGAKSNPAVPPSPIATGCFVSIESTVTIDGTGSSRSPVVVISKVDVLGEDHQGEPNLYFSDLKLTNVKPDIKAKSLAEEILFQLNTGDEASSAMIAMLKAQLNSQENLTTFSNLLTSTLGDALNDVFGPVPAGKLPSSGDAAIPNPVDAYYFDRMRFALNDPTGTYYLPTTLRNFTDPKLEPYTDADIDLPNITLSPPMDTITLTGVKLKNVNVAGFSNSLVPVDNLSLDQMVLKAIGVINAMATPPAGTPAPPLTATADFYANAGPEVGELGPTPAKLTVSSTNAQTTATLQAVASGTSVDELQVTIQSLKIAADASDIELVLTTGASMNKLINSALNTDDVKNTAISGLNSAITGDLAEISTSVTSGLISIINSKLK